MPGSPKRHGLHVDIDESWPLPNTPLPYTSPPLYPPSLSFSASSSNENIDQLTPPAPAASSINSVLLPGFHFSTTDEDVDPAEFHRVAAQLLSGQRGKRDSAIVRSSRDLSYSRQLHCDLGRDPAGRYCCSCGKSYASLFKLREHIAMCAGTDQHPCPTCDKVFETRHSLDRHVVTRHNNNLEACPECGQNFPASQLPKHLASGLGGCDGMVRSSMDPAPAIDRAYRYSSKASPSQHFWIYDGDLSWQQATVKPARDSKVLTSHHDGIAEQTRAYVQRLLIRPALRPNMEACDLCGDMFSKEGDALAQHIGEHSLDFAEKLHRCDDCRIYFANERDLDRHLQSANLNHHCGFTFRHNSGTCSGHHPPTYYKSAITNDHDLMQKHLWAWELSQLRLHRVTVARILAERLTSPKHTKSTSSQECRNTYASLLPHVSVAHQDSLRYESGWLSDRHEPGVAELDAHFSNVLTEMFPEDCVEHTPQLKKIHFDTDVTEVRPDSAVLPEKSPATRRDLTSSPASPKLAWRRSFYDFATRRKTTAASPVEAVKQQGHKRTHSGPISYLRQQASKEWMRPHSLPVPPPIVPSAA